MQYERQRHGTLLPCTPQIFSIKHVIALFSVVWGITVMHRCCGVYDLWFLRVAIAAPNLLFIFCACQWRCAPVLLPSLCGDGGATRVWDRGERYAWRNPPCAPRCCCWLSPTLCWVDGIHISL
ncbi:retrotransposon hot spot (RHS) protein [Trypanosoma cruzi]|nr:retrotransposon hot spot (RHS) protein [Trypanosoma cruzi]